jgi:hypothetical protein
MPSADQFPVKTSHSMMLWPMWVVLIAGRAALHEVLSALPTVTLHRMSGAIGYPWLLLREMRSLHCNAAACQTYSVIV